MDRVTTLTSYNSVIANLMAGELRQNQAQLQVSSGKVANDLKGYGVNAEALTAANTLKTRVDSYVQTATDLAPKLDAQDSALTEVSNAGSGARQAIANAVATGSAAGLMTSLQSFFGQAVAGLNTQYNGSYLFSGGKVDTQPVNASQLADLTSPPAGGIFQNDQLVAGSQLDESTTVKTGMLASNVGQTLFTAFQSMETFNQGGGGPLTGQLTAAQTSFLTGMMQTFDQANKGLTDTQAANGLMQNQVSTSQTTQQDRQTTLQTMIGGITDVDMAQAASRLSQASVALQASAQVFASLQSTSLLNYLGSVGKG